MTGQPGVLSQKREVKRQIPKKKIHHTSNPQPLKNSKKDSKQPETSAQIDSVTSPQLWKQLGHPLKLSATSSRHTTADAQNPTLAEEDNNTLQISNPEMAVLTESSQDTLRKDDQAADTIANNVNPNLENLEKGFEVVGVVVNENVLMDILNRLANIEKQIGEIGTNVKKMQGDVTKLKNESIAARANTLFAPPEGFPLKTLEEFDMFEAVENRQDALYHQFYQFGGITLREALSCGLKTSMTDELLHSSFNWSGTSGNRCFAKSKIASILYLVVKNIKNFAGPNSQIEFKSHMIEVLRTAKQRHRNCLFPSKNRKEIAQEHSVREEEDTDSAVFDTSDSLDVEED